MDPSTLSSFRRRLRQLERTVMAQLQQDPSCCGVSITQCHTLLEIEESGPTTLTRLADRLELDKSTLSRSIDTMVEAGWVERTVHPDSRRAVWIALTARGRSICNRINRRWNGFFGDLLGRYSVRQQNLMMEGLSLLADALSNTIESETPAAACCRPAPRKLSRPTRKSP